MKRKYFCIILGIVFLLLSILPTFAIEIPSSPHAEYVYLYNFETNQTLLEKNSDQRIFPASTVKIMTGILAVEYFQNDFDQKITVPEAAVKNTVGVNLKFQAGEVMTARDLLYALLVGGANDAAATCAYLIAGSVSDFVTRMNEKAIALGANATVYKNPSGMHDDDMYTTVQDIAKITQYAYSLNAFMEIAGSAKYTVPETNFSPPRIVHNRNKLISRQTDTVYYMKEAIGVNGGSTPQAGNCVVAIAQQQGLTYLCIVMGTGNTDTEIYSYSTARELLYWAFENYGYIRVVDTSKMVCEVPVTLSSTVDHVALLPKQELQLYLPLDTDIEKELQFSWKINSSELEAPIAEGMVVGILTVLRDGEILGNIPLVTKNEVDRSEFLYVLSKIEKVTESRWFIATAISAGILFIVYIFGSAIYRYKKFHNGKYR